MRLKYDASTKNKIAFHNVKLEEIYEVFQDYFIPRKKIVKGEVRYEVLGNSKGRILAVIVTPISSGELYVIMTAYEPTNRFKKLYKNKYRR